MEIAAKRPDCEPLTEHLSESIVTQSSKFSAEGETQMRLRNWGLAAFVFAVTAIAVLSGCNSVASTADLQTSSPLPAPSPTPLPPAPAGSLDLVAVQTYGVETFVDQS